MRFLSPLALVGLALIALPVAIHMLARRRAKRFDFPSLKFLRETPSFRLRPRRIQQPLLLAIRVAAIAFLVLGLSRPLVTFGTRTQRTRVILIDASLSMQARGRREAVRETVRRLINDIAPGERAAIITFATESSVLCSLTTDGNRLSEAIDRYQPASGSANYSDAFMLADALLQSEPPGNVSIDLVSDFQQSGLSNQQQVLPNSGPVARAKIVTHSVGAELGRNAFLIDEAVIARESGYEVFASEIVASADERLGGRKSWTMDAADGARMGLEWHKEPNGQVTARIATVAPDDFDSDDERFIAFKSPRRGRALLIERDGDTAAPYQRAALEATTTELGENRFVVDVKSALPSSSEELSSYSLVTLNLHGRPRHDELHTLVNYVRAGGVLWLCIANDIDTVQWNLFANTEDGREFPFSGIERPADNIQTFGFGLIDSDAPAFRFMNEEVLTTLRTVRMHEGFVVTPRAGSSTLMRWSDTTSAFVGSQVGTGTILMLATSPARSAGELGTSVAFPALVSSIAQSGIELREPLSREIGQPVNLGLAPQTSVKILNAKGQPATTQARDLLLHPAKYFPSPGIYHVEAADFSTSLAFNSPVTESETSLAPANEIENIFKVKNTDAVVATSAWHNATERLSNVWRLFLLVALGLVFAEWFITINQGKKANMKVEG